LPSFVNNVYITRRNDGFFFAVREGGGEYV
jgi:hypothetical protein